MWRKLWALAGTGGGYAGLARGAGHEPAGLRAGTTDALPHSHKDRRPPERCLSGDRPFPGQGVPVKNLLVASALALGVLACRSHAADPWADRVVAYSPGTGATPGFTTPAAALGSPERFTGESTPYPASVTPFASPFGADELVSIGAGGSLVLAFDEPVRNDPANPFGIDLLIFSNNFYWDPITFAPRADSLFASAPGRIEVSPDGLAWTPAPFTLPGAMFPTLGFRDETNPFGGPPGVLPTDFTLPVDPSFDWHGATLEQLIAGYASSGGGLGIDLAPLGLSEISFIRFSLGDGPGHFEIDAVSDVRPVPAPGALLGAGAISLAGTTRRRTRARA